MPEEEEKIIRDAEYFMFPHIVKRKVKEASERNQRLYDFLLTFEDGRMYLDEITKDAPKEVKDIKTYDDYQKMDTTFHKVKLLSIVKDLKYIETTTLNDSGNKPFTLIEITEKGWEFMERYENHKANRKLMGFQLEDYKSQKKFTRISIGTTIVTIILSVATFFYQGNKIDKTTIENTILRDSLVLLRVSHPIKVIANDTANKTHK